MATASDATVTFSQPGVLINDNFPDVLNAQMEFVRRRKWVQPLQGMKYYTEKNTNRAYIKHGYVSAGGIVPKRRDEDAIPQMDVIPGFNNTYTPEEYKLGIRITRRMRETDQFDVIDRHMADLQQANRDTLELYAALPFNTAFAATVEWVCADGRNLIDSARTNPKNISGTWSNEETAGALSQSAIDTMRLNFRKNLNEHGRIRNLVMEKLVVPNDLQSSAEVFLTTPQKTGTTVNDNSVFLKRTLQLEVWDYLTSTTAYFGFAPKNELHELFWVWGVRPSTIPYVVGDNPDIFAFRTRMVFVTGADRPQTIRGNAGA